MFPALPFPRTTGAGRAPRAPRMFHRPHVGAVSAVTALVLTTGCGLFTPGLNREMATDINVTSPLMQEGRPLPEAYTCHADDSGDSGDSDDAQEPYSPPLSWSGLPDGVGSIALVVDDPEAAEVFWVVYDLDPQLVELRQNSVPADAKQGRNSAGDAEYGAPCPGEDEEYEYRFTVYALDGTVDLPDGAALTTTLEAIADRAVARGSLVTSSE